MTVVRPLPAGLDAIAFVAMPVLAAGTLTGVLLTSGVGQTFVWVPDIVTTIAWATYITILLGLAARPNSGLLHKVGAVLAGYVFGSRAIAFLEIVVDSGRTDLIGAVLERVLLLGFAFVWHARGAERSALINGGAATWTHH